MKKLTVTITSLLLLSVTTFVSGQASFSIPANIKYPLRASDNWQIKHNEATDMGSAEILKSPSSTDGIEIRYQFTDKAKENTSYFQISKDISPALDMTYYESVSFDVSTDSRQKFIIRCYIYGKILESQKDQYTPFSAYMEKLDLKGKKEIRFPITDYMNKPLNRKEIYRIVFHIINYSSENNGGKITLSNMTFLRKSFNINNIPSIKTEPPSSTANSAAIEIPELTNPPDIKAPLTSPEWQATSIIKPFLLYRNAYNAKKQTETRIGYDKKNLYIAFKCLEPDMAKLHKTVTERDGKIWNDDCIRIWINPQNSSDIYLFMANALGTQYDEKKNDIGVYIREYDPIWECSSAEEDGYWTIKTKIPFTALGAQCPQKGDIWTGILWREEKQLGELSACFITSGYVASTENFGKFVFGSFKDAIAKKYGQTSKSLAKLKADFQQRGKTEEFASTISQLEKEEKYLEDSIPANVQAADLEKIMTETTSLDNRIKNMGYMISGKYFTWEKNTLTTLAVSEIPAELIDAREKGILIKMGENETEMRSLAISNFSNEILEGRIVLSNFQDPQKNFIAPDFISLFSPVFIKLKPDKYIDDPLPSLNNANIFFVPPRENRELIIKINSTGLPAGTYKGFAYIRPHGSWDFQESRIPLEIDVLPVNLQKTHLKLIVFEMENYIWDLKKTEDLEFRKNELTISEKNWPEYIKDMKEHRVNVFRPVYNWVPFPVIDKKNKTITESLNHTQLPFFDFMISEYMKASPDAIINISPYLIAEYLERNGFKYMSEEWESALRTYFAALIGHVKKLGVQENNMAIYLYDEIEAEKFARYIEVTKILRSVNPNIKTFLTIGRSTIPELKTIEPYVDIWCPYIFKETSSGEKLEYLKSTGKPVWIYANTGFSNQTGSPAGIRKLGWMAWKRGIQGIGSWSYNCWINDGWNDFDSPSSPRKAEAYVYWGAQGPVSSRRWEAMRDTMEDYEILFTLNDLIQKAKSKKIMTRDSEELLAHSVEQVLNSSDPAVFSKARVSLMDETIKLQSKLKNNTILQSKG